MRKEPFMRDIRGEVVIEKMNLRHPNANQAYQFRKRLLTDEFEGYSKVVIDISKLEHIDNDILDTLEILLARMERRGGSLKIIVSDHECFDVLTVSGLRIALHLHDSLDEAIAKLG